VSKASLETLARTMSISLLVVAVIAVTQEQIVKSETQQVGKTEIFSNETTNQQTKPVRKKEKQTLKASRSAAPRSVDQRGVWLKALLKEAGFKGKALKTAWAVAMKESTGRPKAYNGNRASGDHSYGIFQINMIGSLGADRRAKFGIKSNTDLFKPLINAKAAYYMSNQGTNWYSWDITNSGYNGGVSKKAYHRWLAKYPEGKKWKN